MLDAYNANEYRFYRSNGPDWRWGDQDITEELRARWKRTHGASAAEASLGQPVLSYTFDATGKIYNLSVVKSGEGVMVGDIVLVSLRDFQDAKGDIIMKYNSDEAKNLKT